MVTEVGGRVFVDALIVLGAIIAIAVPLWGIIDAAGRPASAFEAIGSDKTRWLVLLIVLAVLLNLGGIIASLVYLTTVRPRLRHVDVGALASGRRSPDPVESANLLASDDDRERVTQELHRHFAAGRLSLDDLNRRVEVTLKARTLGELHAVTEDLPQV